MVDVRRLGAGLALVAMVMIAGCGGRGAAEEVGEPDPEAATRATATARLCELWEQARDAADADAAEALLDEADAYFETLPTALRQPARGDARMQCGSAERDARQRIHQERSGG